MTNYKRYDDDEQAAFLEVAVDIGIGPAMRQLGYPGSWITAKRWADNRGVVVEINQMKQQAKSYDLWYNDRDVLLGAEAGMERVMEQLTNSELTPDELKRLSEAYQKYTNVWLTVQGKAANISESHTKTSEDIELIDMLNIERARQSSVDDVVTNNND